MILTLGFRGVYRQAQYETATVEGSVQADPAHDYPAMTLDEVKSRMLAELGSLVHPLIQQAAANSTYEDHETTVSLWEDFTDATGSTAQDSTPQRRVRSRQA